MRNLLLYACFFGSLLIATNPSVAVAACTPDTTTGTVCLGKGCSQIGTTQMDGDQENLIACLFNDAGLKKWKSMTGYSPNSQSGQAKATVCSGTYDGGYCEAAYYIDVVFPEKFSVIPNVIVSPALISDQGGAIGFATDQVRTGATMITKKGFRLWCSGSPETEPHESWQTMGSCNWLAVVP